MKTKAMIEALAKYRKEYGDNLYLNRRNYLYFRNNISEDNRFLHIRVYEQAYGLTSDERKIKKYEIHHIDNCRWNPEIWNLIALTKQQHLKLKSKQLTIGDWKGGLNSLMSTLQLQENDLPSFVLEKLRIEGKKSKTIQKRNFGGEPMVEKDLYCIDCGRPISHIGRCLACNMKAKRKREAQEERKKNR